MYSAEDISRLMKGHMGEGLKTSFPMLSSTTLGDPVPLYDSRRKQSYWLIPFLEDTKVRGLAIVDLKGNLVSHGVLSPNLTDKSLLVDRDFFDSVPQKALEKIKEQYKGYRHSIPFLSYDVSPRKWGWYLELEKEKAQTIQIFIGINGFYEKKNLPDRE